MTGIRSAAVAAARRHPGFGLLDDNACCKPQRAAVTLSCNRWATFLFPWALLVFFAAVFFYAKGEALAAAADGALSSMSAPRVRQELIDTFPRFRAHLMHALGVDGLPGVSPEKWDDAAIHSRLDAASALPRFRAESLGMVGANLGAAVARPGMVIAYPLAAEAAGIAATSIFIALTAACLVLSHVTPAGEWHDVALWLLRREATTGLLWPDGVVTGAAAAADSGGASKGGAAGGWGSEGEGGAEEETVAPLLSPRIRRGHIRGESSVPLPQSSSEGARAGSAASAAAAAAAAVCAASAPLPVISLFQEWKGGSIGWLQRAIAAPASIVASGHVPGSHLPPEVLSAPVTLRACRKASCSGGPKPDRAHHCKHCEACILEMDHHCPCV